MVGRYENNLPISTYIRDNKVGSTNMNNNGSVASLVLLDEDGNSITITQSSDFVVYTNTKIKLDYIPD